MAFDYAIWKYLIAIVLVQVLFSSDTLFDFIS